MFGIQYILTWYLQLNPQLNFDHHNLQWPFIPDKSCWHKSCFSHSFIIHTVSKFVVWIGFSFRVLLTSCIQRDTSLQFFKCKKWLAFLCCLLLRNSCRIIIKLIFQAAKIPSEWCIVLVTKVFLFKNFGKCY